MNLSLFDHCVIVKGAKYIILQDNLRGILYRIPKEVAEYFEASSVSKLSSSQIQEIEEFLITRELAHVNRDLERFPILENILFQPSEIEYCIIECSDYLHEFYFQIFDELNTLNCKYLELRFYTQSNLNQLYHILKLATTTQLRSVDIYYKYIDDECLDLYNQLIEKFPIINIFILHSTPQLLIEELKTRDYKTYNSFIISAQIISNSKCCGKIGIDQFCISIDFYRVSLKHNTCLYRKIGIDQDGNIKNCPSMVSNYGNISSTSLLNAYSNADFRKYWYLNKNDILKCKDCEYRHVCSDCRAYTDAPNNIYSPPLKCGYDPYTGEWSDWSTNPLKENAIQHYNL